MDIRAVAFDANGTLVKILTDDGADEIFRAAGYRKPDRRLFQLALDGMAMPAKNALYVGNDMHRDIFGAREAGLKTVMFDSDQGKKAYRDCVPDYTITDLRDLIQILGL
jgi:putative hydrolase of the HAD superfamily